MKFFAWIAALLVLAGCGMNTAKPVYEGLLNDGVQPRPSSRQMPEVKSARGVAVVLTQSTRDTIEGFKSHQGGQHKLYYPVEKWTAELAAPVRKLHPAVRTAPDFRSKAPENWVIVVHWVARLQPFIVGATIEYHVLDPNLDQVAVFRADDSRSCDTPSLSTEASIKGHMDCYDRFVSGLIQKVGNAMLTSAGM